MNTMTPAYRTTCIPNRDDRLDTLIPSDLNAQPRYNAETEAAMQEVRDIRAGKIKAKRYNTMEELYADIDAEEDD
jgi:hypothetical protein